jgi:hypothetical protein
VADQAFSISPPDIRAFRTHARPRPALCGLRRRQLPERQRRGCGRPQPVAEERADPRRASPACERAVHDQRRARPLRVRHCAGPQGRPPHRLGVPPAAADGEPFLPEHHHV